MEQKGNGSLYNIPVEKELVIDHNFDSSFHEIRKIMEQTACIRVEQIVEIVKRNLKLCLYGCDIDVGICLDVAGRSVEFHGDKNYVRTVYRGESGCFRSMDNKEIVVEIDNAQNVIVYVPLFGPTLSLGVIEIHGLLVPGEAQSNIQNFKRSSNFLKNMITTKDFSFVNKLRFWKKTPIKSYAGLHQKKNSSIIVCGKVREVVYNKNGVPFYGGPRFNLLWEDGKIDIEVMANDLSNRFEDTSQSLGNLSKLDAILTEQLMTFGLLVGTLLEQRKTEMFLRQLREKLKMQQLNITGIVEMALHSLPNILLSVKEVILVGYRHSYDEYKELIQYLFTKDSKKKKNLFSYTSTQFIEESFDKNDIHQNVIIKRDPNSEMWLGLEMVVPEDFQWGRSTEYSRFFVVIHKTKLKEKDLTSFDSEVLIGIVKEIEAVIRTIWLSDLRRKRFKDMLKNIETKLLGWRHLPTNELCYNVLSFIPPDLLTSNIYCGFLEPGADFIQFITAINGSKMEGRRLKRGEGISFDVIDNLKAIIFDQQDLDKKKLLVEGATAEVFYGKKLYKCQIAKVRGHDLYDVEYELDRKIETSVNIDRILPINRIFKAKLFPKAKLPFIGVAIRNRTKGIGIIGTDNINTQSLLDKKIDYDLQAFLEQIGKLLGSTIDLKLKKQALQSLYVVAKSQHADVGDLVKVLFDVLFQSNVFISGLVAFETKLLYPTSNQEIIKKNAANVNIIGQRGEIPSDIMKKINNFDMKRFGKKPIQRFGDKCVWLMCSVEGDSTDIASQMSSKLYGFVICCVATIQEPDYEFYETLQKTISSLLLTILSHKASGEVRHEIISQIIDLCRNFKGGVSFDEVFSVICGIIHRCYHSANLYIGLLGAKSSEINYVLASSQSKMIGKKLLRKDGEYVSFTSIDEEKTMCVTATSTLADSLKHFGPKQQFEFPFVVSPITAGVDSIIGILGADNCSGHNVGESPEQLEEVIGFYNSIATALGNVIRMYRSDFFRARLEELSNKYQSLEEAVPVLKRLLMKYIPFSKRIIELTYHPNIYDSYYGKSGELSQDLILFFVVTNFQCDFASLKAKLKLFWQDGMLQELSANSISPNSYKAVKINIPKGLLFEKVKIHSLVVSQKEVREKELSHTILSLHYFLTCPTTIQTHLLDSTSLTEQRFGSFDIISKLFTLEQKIGIKIDGLRLRFKFSESIMSIKTRKFEIYFFITWNDESIGQTAPEVLNDSIKWKSLNLFLPLSKLNLLQNKLNLEVWCLNAVGSDDYLGNIELSGVDLSDYFQEDKTWLMLNKYSNCSSIFQSIQLEIRGNIIYPSNLDDSLILSILKLENPLNLSKIIALKQKKQVQGNSEFMSCEVGILAARDLFLNIENTESPNTFAILYLNGEEIGNSSIVYNSTDPKWLDESFRIMVPIGEDLESVLLIIELYHIDDKCLDKIKIGTISITGAILTTILLGKSTRSEWFDLEDLNIIPPPANFENPIYKTPQVQIFGRPSTDKLSHYIIEDDKGYLELSLLGIEDLFQSHIVNLDSNHLYAEIRLNSRLAFKSKTFEERREITFSSETVYFRHPTNKTLFQSYLEISICKSSGNIQKNIASFLLSGSEMVKLFSQKGLITKWYNILNPINPETEWKLHVRGGPKDSLEIFEYDDLVLWLDLLSCTNLLRGKPKYSELNDTRPNVVCYIKWNGRMVGKTYQASNVNNILWDKQRFLLRVPVFHDEGERIARCKLLIEIFEIKPTCTDLLAQLYIDGPELVNLFGLSNPVIKWYDLNIPTDESNHNSFADIDTLSSSRIKLRGCIAANSQESNIEDSVDYLLTVVQALNLSNTDAFGGANAFLEIQWNREIVGYTQIAKQSLDPFFLNEIFVLTSPNGISKSSFLYIEVWSLNPGKPRVFLGRIQLPYESIQAMITKSISGDIDEFYLTTHTDFTNEENSLVQGSLLLKLTKINYLPFIHGPKMLSESILWVQSLKNLPSLDSLNSPPTTYYRILRKYEREGGEMVEIFRSTQNISSFNPRYKLELIAINRPINLDWTGFEIKFEIYSSSRDELIGYVLISENDIRDILIRENDLCNDIIEFPLTLTESVSLSNPEENISKVLFGGGAAESVQKIEHKLLFANRKLIQSTENNIESINAPNISPSERILKILAFNLFDPLPVNLTPISLYCVLRWNGQDNGIFNFSIENEECKFEEDIILEMEIPHSLDYHKDYLEIFLYDRSSNILLGNIVLSENLLNKFILEDETATLPFEYGPKDIVDSLPFPLVVKSIELLVEPSKESNRFRLNRKQSSAMSDIFSTEINAEEEEEKEDILSDPKSFDFHFISLQGLSPPKSLKAPDCYILFQFNSKQTTGKQKSYKTGLYKLHSEITLDSEIISIDTDYGTHLSDITLIGKIFLKNQFREDTLISSFSIPGAELVSLLDLSIQGKVLSLSSFLITQSNFKENAYISLLDKASIQLSCKTKIDQTKSPLINMNMALPSNLIEIELTIICATGLGRANLLGLSDPYVVILYEGVELGKSSVISESLDPIWTENQSFTFRFPLEFLNNGEEDQGFDSLLDNGDSFNKYDLLEDGIQKPENLRIDIDFFDYNRVSKNQFLGRVELTGNDIQSLLQNNKYCKKWFPLMKTNSKKSSEQKLVQGKCSLMLSKKVMGENEGKSLDLLILSAKNLKVNNPDTFIILRWNGKIVGTSFIEKSNNFPSWETEKFTVYLTPKENILDCILNIELWYIKSSVNNLLGFIELEKQNLMDFIINSRKESQCYTLTNCPYLPLNIQSFIGGAIEMRCFTSSDFSNPYNNLNYSLNHQVPQKRYVLAVKNAKNLIKIDGLARNTEAFMIIKWNDFEIGRTPSIPKTVNPVWHDQTFIISVSLEENLRDPNCFTNLTLELWNNRHKRRGEYLGSVKLNSFELADIFDDISKKPKLFKYPLKDDLETTSSKSRKKMIQGEIEILFSIAPELSVLNKINKLEDIKVNWLDILDVNEGRGMFEFEFNSLEILPLAIYDTYPFHPNGLISWNDKEIGSLLPLSLTIQHNFQWNKKVYLPIPVQYQASKTLLKINIFHQKSKSINLHIGNFTLSFESLLRLYCGDFIFPLDLSEADLEIASKIWKVFVKFRVKVIFSSWDSVISSNPMVFKRRIVILGAANLPLINGDLPHTKCVILIDGVPSAKSIVISSSTHPTYPRLSLDLIIDVNKGIDLVIEVIFVNPRNRKEIVIGKEKLSFEYLMRPPREPFDIFLGPTGKKSAEYNFALSGQVRVQIFGNNRLDEDFLPHVASLSFPSSSFHLHENVREVKPYKLINNTNVLQEEEVLPVKGHEFLKDEERDWLGTIYTFSKSQELISRPAWVILPLFDIGVRIGKKKESIIGTVPGHKLAFAFERLPDKIAVSDAMLLDDISFSVSSCFVKLRLKDIHRKLREMCLSFLEQVCKTINETCELGLQHKYLLNLCRVMIQQCFPSSKVRFLTLSEDGSSIKSEEYLTSEPLESDIKSVIFSSEYTSDLTLFGKSYNRSKLLKSPKDLKQLSKSSITLSSFLSHNNAEIIFGSVKHFPLPRMSASFSSDDVSLGLIQVENLNVYIGGSHQPLTGEIETLKWLERIGNICGECMYNEKESISIQNLVKYLHCQQSTLEGLQFLLLEEVSTVLQGCKLLEIVRIDKEYKLKSLFEKRPLVSPIFGRQISIQNIRIEVFIPLGLGDDSSLSADSNSSMTFSLLKNQSMMAYASLKSLFVSNKTGISSVTNHVDMEKKAISAFDEDISLDDEDSFENQESIESSLDLNNESQKISHLDFGAQPIIMPDLFLGILYDGLEHIIPLSFDEITQSYQTKDSSSYTLFLKSDRIINFSLYEFDENLQIISENNGCVEFSNTPEIESKIMLNRFYPQDGVPYQMHFSISWAGMNEGKALFDDSSIKGFKINLIRAEQLISLKNNSLPSVFCEIQFGGKVIASSKVIKQTLTPEWNEFFYLPFEKRTAPLIFDLYDYSYLRKGKFLGRVEIPFDELMNSKNIETEYSLKMRKDLKSKKQLSVGGKLFLKLSADFGTSKPVLNADDNKSKPISLLEALNNPLNLSEEALGMRNPCLQLIVEAAKDLASANRFGGASDPFVLIFLGDNPDPIAKTKVLSDTLNPIWEESFSILLNPNKILPSNKINVLSPAEWPKLRFEVYDYNNITASIFLGQCDLTPMIYSRENEEILQLQPKPETKEGKKNKNLFVKGTLQLKWNLIDQLIEIEDEKALSPISDLILSDKGALTTSHQIEIEIIKASDLMKLLRITNSCNPYVLVKYHGLICGKTKTIKNTNSPNFNEAFRVNIPKVHNEILDSLANKSHNQEIKHLYGPLHFEIWHQDFFQREEFLGEVILSPPEYLHPSEGILILPLQSKEESPNPSIKGSLSIRIKYDFSLPTFNISRKPCRLVDNYRAKINQLSKKAESIPIHMVYDPNQEALRQSLEKTSFPSIIEKATGNLEKYSRQPFDRLDIISEAHYGQLCAAARRAERTILKSDFCEMICQPLFNKKAWAQNFSMTNNKSLEEESLTSSSVGQTTSSSNAVNISDTDAKSSLSGDYLVCRYINNKLSRRDIKYLDNLQRTLLQEIKMHQERMQRSYQLNQLIDNIKSLDLLQSSSPEEIMLQCLLDLESSTGCPIKCYMLHEMGKTFSAVSLDDGQIQNVDEKSLSTAQKNHLTFISNLATYCRYGNMIQFYDGEIKIIPLHWEGFNQLELPNYETFSDSVNKLEQNDQFCQTLFSQLQNYSPEGMFVIPLMPKGEHLIGLLTIRNINMYPKALYEYVISDRLPNSQDDNSYDIKSHHDMEANVANLIIQAVNNFATTYSNVRLNHSYRLYRSFPLREETSPFLMIRYMFRIIVICFPCVREISLWCVNFNDNKNNQASHVFSTGSVGIDNTRYSNHRKSNPSKPSFLSRLFSRGTKQTENKKNFENSVVDEDGEENSFQNKSSGSINGGYFGEENVNILLNTPIERKLKSNSISKNTRRNNIRATNDMKGDIDSLHKAKWTIGIPSIFTSKVSIHPENSRLTTYSSCYSSLHEMVCAEIIRCVEISKEKTFRVVSGHALSQIGLDSTSQWLLSSVFNIKGNQNLESEAITENSIPISSSEETSQSETQSRRHSSFIASGLDSSTSKRAPLPKIPPPDSKNSPTSNRRNSETVTSNSISNRNGRNHLPIVPRPPSNSEHRTINSIDKKILYFIAIKTHDIGSADGWGHLGDNILKLFGQLSVHFETNLSKLGDLKRKEDIKQRFESQIEEDEDD